MKYFEYFARHLNNIKRRSGSEYMARCPFHDDKNPSFSFNAETGLWNCFACGEKGNIHQFLERFGETINEKKEKKKKTVFSYYDINGKHLYDKIRYDFSDGSKTFKIEWRSEEKKLVFYNLPSLKRINPEVIYFAEGEKCVEALNKALPENVDNISVLGFQIPEKEFQNSQIEDYLKDRIVYIFEDNDKTGREKAQKLFEQVKKFAKKIYIVRFDSFPEKYDVADFLQEHTLEEALSLAVLEYERKYEYVDLFSLIHEPTEPIEYLDLDFKLPRGVVALLAGMGSVGKGYFALYLSIKWTLNGLNVCYVSAEDSLKIIKLRLKSLIPKVAGSGKQTGKFKIIELTDETIEDIVKEHFKEGFDIIIIDPISFLLEDENANTQAAKLQRKLQHYCKTFNATVILSHHLKKFTSREIKDKFDMLDAIRGAGALHNNARYVFFLKRSKEDDSIVEVYNAKNSYAPNNNDFKITGLFPSEETLTIERIEGSKPNKTRKDPVEKILGEEVPF